ncbi:MAG: bromoperoxidase, partial [Verrucomicrobiota bacterium]
MTDYRREEAKHVRDAASQKAYDRAHREHQNNGDEQRYAAANYAMSFTKGLDHNYETGLVNDAVDFEAFRTAVDNGFAEPFTSRIDVPRIPRDEEEEKPRRKWEAPTAGVVYELQGPDPQSVTMPPAPPLCSDELTFEMAEVYELALLRDVPFNQLEKDGGSTELGDAICRLNNLQYAKDRFKGRPRKTDKAGKLDEQTVFRGSSPGVEKGPYLSQFMIIGNQSPDETRKPSDGYINFGAQSIDQRVVEAEPKVDYMMKWHDWHNVQQGFDVGALGKGQVTGKRRFIYTLRDLATYVHVDALYQAYLNACLILLGNKTPFDPGFDLLSGGGKFYDRSKEKKIDLSAGG